MECHVRIERGDQTNARYADVSLSCANAQGGDAMCRSGIRTVFASHPSAPPPSVMILPTPRIGHNCPRRSRVVIRPGQGCRAFC
jgi:hypothetical protein